MKNMPPIEISSSKKKLTILALVLLTSVVYLNGLTGDFLSDDLFLIQNNPLIYQADPTPIMKGEFFPSPGYNNYGYLLPMEILSYWLNYRLVGLNPTGFHVVNLVMHIFCVLIFFYILRRYFGKVKFGAAWLAAAIFALHPYHTESVTFISGRTDILATVFFLLALGEYIEFREKGRVFALYLSLCAFGLGMLSKEILLIFLPTILLWEFAVNERRDFRGALTAASPFVAATVLYFPIRALLLGSTDKALSNPSILTGVLSRLFYAPVLLSKYFTMLIAPLKFNAYRFEEFGRLYSGDIRIDIWTILGLIAAVLIFAAFFILLAKKRRVEAFWFGIIILGLLPVLNIVPIGTVPLSERFIYLPSLGFSVVLAVAITAVSDRVKAKNPKSSIYAFAAIFLIMSYSILTYIRNFDWRNELMFYSAMIRTEPLSEQGHSGMAKVYNEMGELDSVIYYAQKSLSINNNVQSWLLLSDVYIFRQEFATAESALVEAERLSPENSMVQLAQANLEYSRHDYPTARTKYDQIISRWPDFYLAHLNLGRLEYRDCRYPEALNRLEEARRLKPSDPEVYRLLSMVYSNLGENEKARQAWREYLRLPGVKVGDFTGDDDAPGVIPQSMRGR